ncbi:MAG: GH3 auxin-responsive promoter family protein [Flavobacteriaceae bacterium]|nr:GH3 auxin-responsive promoter family protein [Flavobacteriaceae bacterium]MCY4216648.1 GH3 auxin-responsive promoter family protein [Flavobacteriaceae bacterium]
MPHPWFHLIASWLLKKRIHQIELFIKYPVEVQLELMLELLKVASNTQMGRQYDFASIENYETFKSRLPLVEYEQITHLIDRCRKGEQNIFWPTHIKWFAKSSGTTNDKSKYIPVSTQALESCHYKAGKDMLSLYFHNNPKSQLLAGKNLKLGGSHELYHKHHSYYGDLSAIIIDNLPFWAKLSSTPNQSVSLMGEWESKMKAIVKKTVKQKVTGMAGVPSWMLSLLNEVLKHTEKENIKQVWPNLEVYFHGGVSFNPYMSQFEQLIPDQEFKYYEIYNASEGFLAIQDRNYEKDLLLMLDYGIFYEFIPLGMDQKAIKDQIVTIDGVELGVQYEIVITTNAGLWRYRIGDTIIFTSLSPYRIQVTGRTKSHINAFGEELIVDNAEKALEQVNKKHQSLISDYTVAPIFMDNGSKGSHQWIIEFKSPPKDINQFTVDLDQALQNLNSDYQAKRYKNITVDLPMIHMARENLFYDWLASKNKLGGQHKVPRLSNSRQHVEQLLKFEKSDS